MIAVTEAAPALFAAEIVNISSMMLSFTGAAHVWLSADITRTLNRVATRQEGKINTVQLMYLNDKTAFPPYTLIDFHQNFTICKSENVKVSTIRSLLLYSHRVPDETMNASVYACINLVWFINAGAVFRSAQILSQRGLFAVPAMITIFSWRTSSPFPQTFRSSQLIGDETARTDTTGATDRNKDRNMTKKSNHGLVLLKRVAKLVTWRD